MDRFEIFISDDYGISCTNSNMIDLNIYIKINGIAFPSENWTDLAISVLGMWSESIIHSEKQATANLSFYFMEGLYWLELQKEDTYLIGNAFSNGEKVDSISPFHFRYADVCQELLRAWDRVDRFVFDERSGLEQSVMDAASNTINHYRNRFQLILNNEE